MRSPLLVLPSCFHGGCQSPAKVRLYERNPINLHYPLLQKLGRTQFFPCKKLPYSTSDPRCLSEVCQCFEPSHDQSWLLRPFLFLGGYTNGHAPKARRDSAENLAELALQQHGTCNQVVYESGFFYHKGCKYASCLGCVLLQVKEEKAAALRWNTLKT